MSVFGLYELGGNFSHFAEAVRKKNTAVFSLSQGSKAHLTSELPQFVLYVTADRLAARSMTEKINAFRTKKAVYIAEKDDVLLHRRAYSTENTYARIGALKSIVDGTAGCAVISPEGLLQLFPNAELFKNACFTLTCEQEIEPSEVTERLSSSGYRREQSVAQKGDYAVRGDIVDIFPTDAEEPIRISFFDTIIEEIRAFDLESGVSHARQHSVSIAPASDFLIDEQTAEKAVRRLRALEGSGSVADIVADVIYRLERDRNDFSLVWALPFVREAMTCIFSYLPQNSIIVFDEPRLIADKLELYAAEHRKRVAGLCDAGGSTEKHKNSLLSYAELERYWKEYRLVSYGQIMSSNPIFEPKAVFVIKSQAVTKYYLDSRNMVNELKNFMITNRRVVLCCGSAERAAAIAKMLYEEGLYAAQENTFSGASRILATDFSIQTGFMYPEINLVVVGTDELIGKQQTKTHTRRNRDFITPKVGDYVVHRVHGIGICTGIVRHKVDDIEKEYVSLEYREGASLMVPTDQMDNLELYSGADIPRLSKIGGKEFAKVKERVKQSVKKLAVDLLRLYSSREHSDGYKYSPDTEWQREFEDEFEFTPTDDQLEAVKKIKEEMERGKIIDRLVCGDVGFGKTEVALRAIFKTVMDGKQAAILAPTTILARQHYNTLRARLQSFGIRVELLSRFQKKTEIDYSLKQLETGDSLIVVATHRLLSADVVFKDLGLLVLDEEQRFGVEHKEKIKDKYPTVNVLTLSATPIPRTLNMALTGIRDISLLETPPQGRLPIQTYITEYSDALIKDAIQREVARGGQVFVLYNRVETIDSFAAHVKSLVGDGIRLLVGHGQLSREALDERMTAFYAGEADVLVATTIIENGIDLPAANTLIVINADMFGLAQLYQLRGRVGRSGSLAHAYFTTAAGKVLTDDSLNRLIALMDNTEFGSGFKIAMRDLEIRGAGNIMGAEQHGHIEKVGYQTYLRLLEEAVMELKGEIPVADADVELKIDANTYIRDTYVSQSDKFKIYRQIAQVANFSDRDKLIEELTDVYGKPEQPLLNLVDISLMKNMAARAGIKKIVITRAGSGMWFADGGIWQNPELLGLIAGKRDEVLLTDTIPPQLVFNSRGLTAEQKIGQILEFFRDFVCHN